LFVSYDDEDNQSSKRGVKINKQTKVDGMTPLFDD
jgi:hypothetical protein